MAQQMLSNLHANIKPIREDLAKLLGMRAHTATNTLVARLCGLSRSSVPPVIKRVDQRHACIDPQPVAGPGRGKKRHNLSPIAAENSQDADRQATVSADDDSPLDKHHRYPSGIHATWKTKQWVNLCVVVPLQRHLYSNMQIERECPKCISEE